MPKFQTQHFFSAANRPVLLALLLLMVLPFLLFYQVWWPDADHRQVFEYGDFIEQHYAMRTFVARELRYGRLPLWDPYTFAGQPAIADSLFATFYPLGLWQVLFSAPMPLWVLEVEAVAHLALAAIFTFLLLHRLTGSVGAGAIGGTAFALSGWATSYPMLQIIILETAIWLPAGLWMLERALAHRSYGTLGLAGMLFGVGLLAGHPQTFLYVTYLSAAYFFFRSWRLNIGWRFTWGGALLLGGIILGVSAAQWFPSLQMYGFSPRFGLEYEAVAHGFVPSELWGLLRANPGQWSPLYVGLIPLGLALLSLFLYRRREVYFWAFVAFVSLFLSLGKHGFLYPIAYHLAPGFSVFRDQERIAFLVSFALAILAGYGYATLARRRTWVRALFPLLLLLTFVDLFRTNNGVILQPPPPDGYFVQSRIVQHLQAVGEPMWRISSEGLLPGGANAGMVFRVRDVVGSAPLYLAALDQFTSQVPELRWWQMLNVQHLLSTRTLEHGALLPVMEEGDRRLYQVFVGAQPAWIVHDIEVVDDQERAILQTADPELDPMATAVLEELPDPLPEPPIREEDVQIVEWEHQRLVTKVTLSSPGIVVLSEVSYPGWVPRVEGESIPSLRAYGLLRAVALPAGEWRVEWHFEPFLVWLGLMTSTVTILVTLFLYAAERRRKRRRVQVELMLPNQPNRSSSHGSP
ncbi:MAG: hypothetical protein M3220_20280 [Chloroflexota bacterium]|nr:hypothetical protein [Chloroflexota bacterium]